MMNSRKTVCYKCADRYVGCHAMCEKYQAFCEDNNKRRATLIAGRIKYSIPLRYELDRADKISKKTKGGKR